MTSTRLPGKVLADLDGHPMLYHVLRRARRCNLIDDVVVATTDRDTDDPVVAVANGLRTPCVRGSEHDVLERYAKAAATANADVIVRITADCPLLDPGLTDRVIWKLIESGCDYASNTMTPCYPLGLAAEAFRRGILDHMAQVANHPAEREHVTAYVHRHCDQFDRQAVFEPDVDDSDLRWTVDTADDFSLVAELYQRLALGRFIRPYAEVVSYVRKHPELTAINAHVAQKATYAA